MEINIGEQKERLVVEVKRIGEQLAQVQNGIARLQQEQQALINEALKNQGALELLQSLNSEA